MKNKFILSFTLILASLQPAHAEIKKSFIDDLEAAVIKLNAKPKSKKRSSSEPATTRFKEFGTIVDESYELLQEEKNSLFKIKVVDEDFTSRIDKWVLTASLSLQLDPALSVSDLLSEVALKFPNEVKLSMDKLNGTGKAKILNVLRLEEQLRREGNAG